MIGGNLGEREKNLRQARELLEANCGKIKQRSSVYETAAWGKTDQPDFLNQVLELETKLDAAKLMRDILKIESQMGRERNEKYSARTIDVDILFFNDEIIDQPGLIVPHPQLHTRRFVLTPLNEIASQLIHPIFKKNISELLEECADKLEVKLFS
jgi:2-amino-4-hydroxy-6-hydroxymethyldihydropteridine diphosphokinase